MATLCERTTSQALRVDRQSGVIHGVRVCGLVSSNGRRYTREALGAAIDLYEKVHVFVDHPSLQTPDVERSYRDRIGQLEGVHLAADGLRGNLKVNKAHPLAEMVIQDAEDGSSIGLSHNADGDVKPGGDGTVVVERITRVRSVDLVCSPATCSSFFESHGDRSSLAEFKAGILVDDRGGCTSLIEAIGDDNADPDASLKSGFIDAIRTAIDDPSLDLKGTMKRIRQVLTAQEKLLGPLGELPVEDDFDDDDATHDQAELNMAGGGAVSESINEAQLAEFRYNILH